MKQNDKHILYLVRNPWVTSIKRKGRQGREGKREGEVRSGHWRDSGKEPQSQASICRGHRGHR